MLGIIPLMIIPFILYNLALTGFLGGGGIGILQMDVFSMTMISGAIWSIPLGDVLIVLALFLLFFEILKATRSGTSPVLDHLISMAVFIAFLIEFLVAPGAATRVFFILTVIALIDVIAGFSVSIKTARRDVAIGL